LNKIRYRYPSEYLPDGTTSAQWLRHVTFEGAKERYPNGVPAKVLSQLEKELEIIEALDYPGYFLTMWELVSFYREKGILCQGRGSAANSAVCYCLGVTAIDPVRMELLFERFISKERAEPPDIDLDIEHDRREEVIQHV
jgi:error-prone DNA polymerase